MQHEEAKEPAKEEPVVQSSGFSKIYALYDQGLNARLVGNLGDAVNQLKKAARLVRMEPRPLGKPLTMEAMIDYELGQAAEADNNLPLAVESYEECLKADPRHIDASVHLSGTLLRAGQPLMALMKARDAVERNPQEPRAHAILAVALEKNGFADDAKLERQKAQHLLKFKTQPEPRVPVIEESDRVPSSKEEDKSMDAEPNADAPKNVEVIPAKSDAQSVAPLPGN